MLLLAGAAGGGVALAVASVPDSSGVIHACYVLAPGQTTVPKNAAGNVYIIDPSPPANQSCNPSTERELTWKAQGPAGARGPQGPSGPGFTVSTKIIRPSASPAGHITLGTGKHKISADILALSFAGVKGSGGGGGAGKVSVHDISITKKVDKSSPVFFKNCVSGTHYKKVTLAMRKAGGGPNTAGTLTYTLTNVIISSYQEVSSGGGKSTPEESITFNFTKISTG